MAFCITIKENSNLLGCCFYSNHFGFNYYDIVKEVIECANNFNDFYNIKDKNNLVFEILNTYKNLEFLGYGKTTYSPQFYDSYTEILALSYPDIKIIDNKEDYRSISLERRNIEKLIKCAKNNIYIDIKNCTIEFDIFDIVSEEIFEKIFKCYSMDEYNPEDIYLMTYDIKKINFCDLEEFSYLIKKSELGFILEDGLTFYVYKKYTLE